MESRRKINSGTIGVFDSGYGGLTILSEFQNLMPEYNYIYLGDNSRAPYGSRSFDVVYEFTKQAVVSLFEMGCNLVILACNTASAKALRTIQQKDLPSIDLDKRVLGVIRPTAEAVGEITKNGHVGIVGTIGTIQSESYPIEIKKTFPRLLVTGEACPMWVPLIENNEHLDGGADFFVKKDLKRLFGRDPKIDTLILACTHYPLLLKKIKEQVPEYTNIVLQGPIVAKSLQDYLKRHPHMDESLIKESITEYYTTESPDKFSQTASLFLGRDIEVKHIRLD